MTDAPAEQAAPAFADRLKALRIQEYGLAAVVVLLFIAGAIRKNMVWKKEFA